MNTALLQPDASLDRPDAHGSDGTAHRAVAPAGEAADPHQLLEQVARETGAPQLPQRMPLGERLVRAGIITQEELDSAINEQSLRKTRLGEALTQLGFVEEGELIEFLGEQLGVPSVRLREGLIDPQAVRLLPRNTASRFHALALFRVRGTLTVAMAEPQNLQQIDEIERITGLRVRPLLVLRSTIDKMIDRAYEDDYEVDAVTADVDVDSVEVHDQAIDLDLNKIESLVDGSPVVNLVSYLIVHAVRQGVSDIHIEPGHQYTAVRYRVDGQLREVLRPRRDLHPALVSRLKVMGKMDIAEHRAPQDGRIHVMVEGREIDLRISTLPTVLGEKVVLRVLDKQNLTFNLDEMGVPDPLLAELKRNLARPHGLMLVTGPTGSGKTTTLYSSIELIKSVTRNIVTVEDPVEYQLELINQVQVAPTKAMSFAGVLRSILRQDPDVIMVGEIRDTETAEIAIQAALTGHLVLSTLHTNDSPAAVTRLIDMGVAPYKIAAALAGVLAQRLVRTICPKCRTTYYPSTEILNLIDYQGDRRRQFQRGEGCEHCFDTGFRGRVGIYEFFRITPETRQLISSGASLQELQAKHLEQGGTTLLQAGIQRAEEGITSLDEVIRVAYFD
jgi:type IV pilus assembly protein PilB